MPWYKVDEFLNKVCKNVKYKGAHASISEELQNHIQDRIYDLIDQGFDEETAIKKAVEAMGDPVEIGKRLNKLHRPYVGWFLSMVNTLIMLVGIYVLSTVIPSVFRIFEPFSSIPSGKDIKYSVNLNEKDRIDDRTVVVKKLVVDKNGSVYIRYDDYSKLFSQGWSMLDFQIYDDKGNRYYGGGEGKGNIFGNRHLMHFDNLNKDAKKLILNYDYYNRKMRFELSLSGGDGV